MALTEQQIRTKLEQILCDQLGIKEKDIAYDVTLEELGGDSLDLVEIVMRAEDVFDIVLEDDDELDAIQTVGNLVACVKKHFAEKTLKTFTGLSLEKLTEIFKDVPEISGAVGHVKSSCRVSATLTSEQRKMWVKLGAGDWLRRYLDATSKGRTTT